MNGHPTREEDFDLYALGALEGDEKRAIESHVAACSACAQKLAEAQGRMARLAFAAPVVEPSPRVKQRLLEQIHGASEGRAPERMRGAAERTGGFMRPWWAGALVPAGVVLAVAAIFLWKEDTRPRAAACRRARFHRATAKGTRRGARSFRTRGRQGYDDGFARVHARHAAGNRARIFQFSDGKADVRWSDRARSEEYDLPVVARPQAGSSDQCGIFQSHRWGVQTRGWRPCRRASRRWRSPSPSSLPAACLIPPGRKCSWAPFLNLFSPQGCDRSPCRDAEARESRWIHPPADNFRRVRSRRVRRRGPSH